MGGAFLRLSRVPAGRATRKAWPGNISLRFYACISSPQERGDAHAAYRLPTAIPPPLYRHLLPPASSAFMNLQQKAQLCHYAQRRLRACITRLCISLCCRASRAGCAVPQHAATCNISLRATGDADGNGGTTAVSRCLLLCHALGSLASFISCRYPTEQERGAERFWFWFGGVALDVGIAGSLLRASCSEPSCTTRCAHHLCGRNAPRHSSCLQCCAWAAYRLRVLVSLPAQRAAVNRQENWDVSW